MSMIQEYAVDPEVFSTLSGVNQVAAHFGWDQGRLIAMYPKWKTWKSLAKRAVTEQQDVKRKSILEKIGKLNDKQKLIDLGRNNGIGNYDGAIDWLLNARGEHSRRPFRAVIAKDEHSPELGLHHVDEVDFDVEPFSRSVPCWIPRKAAQMANALGPLLRASRSIKLIDPHFHPGEERFLNPLRAFIAESTKCPPLTHLEIHTSRTVKGAPPKVDWERACRANLAALVPSGVPMTVYRWSTWSGGETFHARYVATEVAAVNIEHGLDEGNDGESTQASVLNEVGRSHVWNLFTPDSNAYLCEDVVELP